MKRFLILATALMMALSASAHGSTNKVENNGQEQLQPGIYWEKGTLMQALEKAKKEGDKMVFLDCYASWCGPCKYMAGTVFTTKEAGDYFNKKFVNIKIDMEKGEGINLARQFRIQGYPTFIILNSNGKELGRIVGGAQINEFIQKVEQVLKQAK